MKTNTRPISILTHEGATARHISPAEQLRRSVASCLLWEREFYEDGEEIAARIARLVGEVVPSATVAALAIEAREKFKLRHVPLLLTRELARHGALDAAVLAQVIQRADELSEFLSIYWREKRQPLAAQVKKGLALAFGKFSAYELAKYNRDATVKLRDVLFLCHAKPKDEEQAALWKHLIAGTLEPPDTWEVALSSGADKTETWTRLLVERKLGGLALLRNLRNMLAVNVPDDAIRNGLRFMKVERVLPFRFVAAARYAPRFEPDLEGAMFRALVGVEPLLGPTTLLIDVSGSMDAKLSSKSDLERLDAACGLAMLLRELCQDLRVVTFSSRVAECPPRRGFALRDSIVRSQPHAGTYLGAAVQAVTDPGRRLIVITDEQSHDTVPDVPGYLINVASARNGVGYGTWTHIDGFSESVVTFIREIEK